MSMLERVRAQESTRLEQDTARATREHERAVLDRLRSDLIERLGLSVVSALAGSQDETGARRELSVALESLLNTRAYGDVPAQDHGRLTREVLDGILGLGPLQPLLDDATVTEVMVNGVQSLFYECGGALHPAQRVFDSPDQIMMVVDRILAPLGRRLDESSPIVNARLANGYRVNAVLAGVGIDGPYVTIRKFSDRITSLARLVELNALPAWYADLLRWAVRTRADVAVAGGTGSGKTTLLNALSCEIDPGERIVTIEDSAELKFTTHPHVVRLEAREASIEGQGRVSIRDLVINSLRMRPDRIVVGEVRGEECVDMLQAMNTGHDGSLTTLHAGSADEAVLRLVLMARFGMDLPTAVIEEQVATAIDVIVMARRMADGSRVIADLSAVRRGEDGRVELEPLVAFDAQERSWQLVQEPAWVQQALAAGACSPEEVRTWRAQCCS